MGLSAFDGFIKGTRFQSTEDGHQFFFLCFVLFFVCFRLVNLIYFIYLFISYILSFLIGRQTGKWNVRVICYES